MTSLSCGTSGVTVLPVCQDSGRNEQRHASSVAQFPFAGRAAAVKLGNALHDCQPKPDMAGCCCAGWIGTVEAVKDVRDVFRRNAATSVGDFKSNPLGVGRHR